MSEEVWIFGYGSLIWRAGFEWAESVPGFIRGFERKFWQLSEDHRGVPGKREVWGVAYRLKGDSEEVQKIIVQLDHREQGGYERTRATFHSRDDCHRSWDVTLYLASHENPLYSPHLGDIAQLAQQVHESVGPSGPNTEYVLRLAQALRELGGPSQQDEHLFDLERHLLKLQHSDLKKESCDNL